MKKTYTKPVLYAETFQPVEHIALNCVPSPNVNATDATACYYQDANLSLFNDGVTGCTNEGWEIEWGESLTEFLKRMTEGGMMCYNAFSNGAVFAS